ncbi:hypothetical protein F4X33_20720 [Candidatus Poribacteria bacterium]|nr:hypothetical protein [Candidatus Poribacteria bacterium]
MEAATAATIAAGAGIAAVIISLLNMFWKMPDIDKRLSDLNGDVQYIKGMLEGLGLSSKFPKKSKKE